MSTTHVLVINKQKKIHTFTIAAVLEVGPDNIFLGETEHAQSASSHAGVDNHSSVCHQVGTLIEPSPDSHIRYFHMFR